MDAYAAMHNTTEIISNCNKEELMEIINTARNLDDYKQSTDSEILQALINGDIQIVPDLIVCGRGLFFQLHVNAF